jgi:hypothetical protein
VNEGGGQDEKRRARNENTKAQSASHSGHIALTSALLALDFSVGDLIQHFMVRSRNVLTRESEPMTHALRKVKGNLSTKKRSQRHAYNKFLTELCNYSKHLDSLRDHPY